ncbi:hypothetical protein [Bradyrhizobium sp.]|jgi:hypothetical protein|uniref:hypothetical protein n=1 Tax=Bradyrhizobium sp. TaxID=376 RepID=UPI003C2659A3
MLLNRLYALATALILAGIAMLCQPFFFFLHSCAFPVLLAGVALFMVLDHLPSSAAIETTTLEHEGDHDE